MVASRIMSLAYTLTCRYPLSELISEVREGHLAAVARLNLKVIYPHS